MTELALYRKYRPARWSEVVGQSHIIEPLKRAVKEGGVVHAYLFSGSRGTGKTSVARILATALKTAPEDLYEIDAASNRGIDEIRALREAVKTLPFSSPFKIYLVDEVHMLTKEAFNALLKTLEEPPGHVVFILATTEPHKLPETIISRCQHFIFRPPSLTELEKHLVEVAKAEGYQLAADAAELLALLGDGSYRDALGALQKAIGVSRDKKIVRAEIEQVTGAPRTELVQELVLAILDRDLKTGLAAVGRATAGNDDLKLLLKLMMAEIRLAMLGRLGGLVLDQQSFAASLANHPRADKLPAILRQLLDVHDDLNRSYLPALALELGLIKLASELQ